YLGDQRRPIALDQQFDQIARLRLDVAVERRLDRLDFVVVGHGRIGEVGGDAMILDDAIQQGQIALPRVERVLFFAETKYGLGVTFRRAAGHARSFPWPLSAARWQMWRLRLASPE